MLYFIRKIFVRHGRCSIIRISPIQRLYFLQLTPFSSSITIESSSVNAKKASFACSYLINEFGFDKEKALSASRYVNFKTPDKPDSVRAFLKDHGFTESQISHMVKKFPSVLLCNPNKTLLPKIKFFESSGISQEDLTDLLATTPHIFWISVMNRLMPTFKFLKGMTGAKGEAVMAMKTIARHAGNLCFNFELLLPNIHLLRDRGVPDSNIASLFNHSPRVLLIDNEKFREIVEDVKTMGFDPLKVKFVLAIKAFTAMSKVTWLKKMEVFKKCGFSEAEILEAFVKYPWCMMVSSGKIVAVVDFLVNKMGFERSVFLKRPLLLSLSLDKRIIPRCFVYQTLLAKGLIKNDLSLLVMLEVSEKKFLERYIECHKIEASRLLKIYREAFAVVQ